MIIMVHDYKSRFYAEEMAASSDVDVYIKPEHQNDDSDISNEE